MSEPQGEAAAPTIEEKEAPAPAPAPASGEADEAPEDEAGDGPSETQKLLSTVSRVEEVLKQSTSAQGTAVETTVSGVEQEHRETVELLRKMLEEFRGGVACAKRDVGAALVEQTQALSAAVGGEASPSVAALRDLSSRLSDLLVELAKEAEAARKKREADIEAVVKGYEQQLAESVQKQLAQVLNATDSAPRVSRPEAVAAVNTAVQTWIREQFHAQVGAMVDAQCNLMHDYERLGRHYTVSLLDAANGLSSGEERKVRQAMADLLNQKTMQLRDLSKGVKEQLEALVKGSTDVRRTHEQLAEELQASVWEASKNLPIPVLSPTALPVMQEPKRESIKDKASRLMKGGSFAQVVQELNDEDSAELGLLSWFRSEVQTKYDIRDVCETLPFDRKVTVLRDVCMDIKDSGGDSKARNLEWLKVLMPSMSEAELRRTQIPKEVLGLISNVSGPFWNDFDELCQKGLWEVYRAAE